MTPPPHHPHDSHEEASQPLLHLTFSPQDLGPHPEKIICVLSGDPGRSRMFAEKFLQDIEVLNEYRGLYCSLGKTPDGKSVLCATSGMGAPSLSIVVNELFQAGIRKMIRIGTCGAWGDTLKLGDIIISKAAVCEQGAALDFAPSSYPASADPFLTVQLYEAAQKQNISCQVAVTYSSDTFYEGQGRARGGHKYLLPHRAHIVEQMSSLNVMNAEMEMGTLFKMGLVYGFQAAGLSTVVAQRRAGPKGEKLDYSILEERLHQMMAMVLGAG